MCINTKIQALLQQKQELDAKIAKLEQFDRASSTVQSLLEKLIEEYQSIIPEELNEFLGELAMTLSANEADEDDDPLGTRASVEAEFCEPSAEDIALVEQYREPNNPIPQEAAEAIESALEDEEARSQEAENMLAWGFTLWDEEQLKAFGEPAPDDFVGSHKDWEIYFSIPNGGVVGIQLKSPHGDYYDRSTEIDEEYGFPTDLSLDNFWGILSWTKQTIDNIEYAIYPKGYFTKKDDPRIELFSGTLKLDSLKMTVKMSPSCHQKCGVTQLAGVTFKFFDVVDTTDKIFETSQTAEEIADRQPMYMALMLAVKWLKNSKQEIANSSRKTASQKADDFAEFVKISNSVGYLKRKDNGLILSGYIGFSNKSENGDRAPSSAKPRAEKWSNFLKDEFDGIECEARKAKRIVSDIEVMPFAYEVKVKGASIDLLQKLANENLEFPPSSSNEVSSPSPADTQMVGTWTIAVNGYTFKSSQDEQEARTIFEKEILNLSPVCLMVELYKGATRLERCNFHELNFTQTVDFDELNPEFDVDYAPSNSKVKVWSSLRSANGKTERLWRHNLLQPGEEIALHTREAAAVHAIRRQQQQTNPQI